MIASPKKIIIAVGKNKIVDNLEEAISRIRTHAAPLNAKRLNKKTPCVKTGKCMDCNSPDRICRTLVITQKPYPDTMYIVLINKELGY